MSNQHPNNTIESNKIEPLLAEQDNKLQAIVEILQIILVDLNEKSANQKAQEQLILQALVELNSNAKQANTLHKESQATTQKSLNTTQESLSALEQENEKLQTHCRQMKQQVKKQNEILEEHFSIKYTALQYGSIALLAAVTTVVGIKFFPPSLDSMLPSKNLPELQGKSSEEPVKAPRKSK